MTEEAKLAADLTQAGAAIETAIEQLRQRDIGPLPIASAMLGAALGLLAQVMDDNAILSVLHSAALGVSSGELRESLKEEDSSFSDEKEAKRLLRGCRGLVGDSRARSFLVLFFKKELFLPNQTKHPPEPSSYSPSGLW